MLPTTHLNRLLTAGVFAFSFAATTMLQSADVSQTEKIARVDIPAFQPDVPRPAGQSILLTLNGVPLKMIWCPPGEFAMGSPTNEIGRDGDEHQHNVSIPHGFWIAETELTQGQFKSITDKNPARFQGDTLPIESVTWEDSRMFCETLTRLAATHLPQGWSFRLPAEEQWEYACRAQTTTSLNNGKNITVDTGVCPNLEKLGWYSKNSGGHTHPVGQKQPNAWGIFDMHGNVWEWCSNPYEPRSVPAGTTAAETDHVIRGGCWFMYPGYCRSAIRYSAGSRDKQLFTVGFRPVLCRN